MSNTRTAQPPRDGAEKIRQTEELHRRVLALAIAGDKDALAACLEEYRHAPAVLGACVGLLAGDVADLTWRLAGAAIATGRADGS